VATTDEGWAPLYEVSHETCMATVRTLLFLLPELGGEWRGNLDDLNWRLHEWCSRSDRPHMCESREELCYVLRKYRPALRAKGYLLAPRQIDPTSRVSIGSRPAGHVPSWGRRRGR
jgi:hypothetical protein